MAIIFIAVFSIFFIQPTLAIETGLEATAGEAGFETGATAKDPSQIVAGVVQIALGLVGTLFLIFIIVSGFQWMMAGGNSEIIGKAKQRIINATIGLIIVLGAYAITTFVVGEIISL